MSPIVDVPLNTAIADLDEGLRGLVRTSLKRHGFDGVEISFDAPSREWSGKLTGPAVNLFLYDVREARDRATSSPESRDGVLVAPSLRLALTYAVTAWTKAVEDEHRLLSQVLSILFSHARLPEDVLGERSSGARGPVETAVGRPREDKADFWNAVGGQYKASIDYVVQIEVESGTRFERGPEVRTRTIRMRQSDGRFRLARVGPGTHRVIVRTLDGRETEAKVTVPGAGVDMVVGPPDARKRRRSAA